MRSSTAASALAPHDFSVTIGQRNGANLGPSLFGDASSWMEKRAVRGLTSLERGETNSNLHLQGWMLGLKKDFGDSKEEEAALQRKIRMDCGWTPADKVKITIKPFIRQQTFSGAFSFLIEVNDMLVSLLFCDVCGLCSFNNNRCLSYSYLALRSIHPAFWGCSY